MSKQQEKDSKGSFPLAVSKGSAFGGFGRSPRETASVSVHERWRDVCGSARQTLLFDDYIF